MPARERIRVKLSKIGSARYMSHLDFMRTLERALRRSDAPSSYSKGFNPRPKFTLATALPVGVASKAEICDFFLDRYVGPGSFSVRFNECLPPGVSILQATNVSLNSPALGSLPQSSVYEVFLGRPLLVENLQNHIRSFLDSSRVLYTRSRRNPVAAEDLEEPVMKQGKGSKRGAGDSPKIVDLRQAVLSLEAKSPSEVSMWVTECRPEEVLESLALMEGAAGSWELEIRKSKFYVKPQEKWLDPMEFGSMPGSAGRLKWGV